MNTFLVCFIRFISKAKIYSRFSEFLALSSFFVRLFGDFKGEGLLGIVGEPGAPKGLKSVHFTKREGVTFSS